MGLFDKMMRFANGYRGGADQPDGATSKAAEQSPRERSLLEELAAEAEEQTPAVRYALLFSGTVQGVGFRWNNQMLARDRKLTGRVRNLDDGTVEMEIQGPPATVGAHFGRLHAYYSRFGNRIWLDRAEELPVVPGERDFRVIG